MSRIGKQSIPLPDQVDVIVADHAVTVRGPRGELSRPIHRSIAVEVVDKVVRCTVARNSKQAPALWGTTRANIANMVRGVSEGFTKKLELQGVGYRAKLAGKNLELSLGYSHPIVVPAPAGITFMVEKEIITVSGIDAELVGQIAADIREHRKPEPYKGKGVRYVGEHVRRKVGKVVGAAAE